MAEEIKLANGQALEGAGDGEVGLTADSGQAKIKVNALKRPFVPEQVRDQP